MRITESKIKSLIRQALLEIKIMPPPVGATGMLQMPSQDKVQQFAYEQLLAGKSIKEIFPGHDRESLNQKVELLYNYIKEKQLPMPEIVGGPDEFGYVDQHARAKSENVSREDLINVLEDFAKINAMELSNKVIAKLYRNFLSAGYISNSIKADKKIQAVKKEFENLPKIEQIKEIKGALFTTFSYLKNDIKNKEKKLYSFINQEYPKYLNNPNAEPNQVITPFLYNKYEEILKYHLDQHDLQDYSFAVASFAMLEFLSNYNSESYYGIKSLNLRIASLRDQVVEKATDKRIGSQRKVMTQLKSLATEQIKGDTANWFAVHYPGAFSSKGKQDTYLETLTSFIQTFGGPGGISSDEYAAVPYPKSAKKLNDSLAAGKAGNVGHPKIGMVLNGTVTGIYSDDVHSDTFGGFTNYGSGIGQLDQIDQKGGFVRFPGGEQTAKNKRRKAATTFKSYDKHVVLDLEAAENEIANADNYPGVRGYYECFVDDWYVEGIVCDWKEFMKRFPYASLSGPEGIGIVIDFLKVVKEKKIKIYDKNFSTKMIGGFNGLVDMFQSMLHNKGIMKFQKLPDGSIKGALDSFKSKIGEK